MMANFEQKKIMFNKKPLTLEKGSFITSVRKLSERWGWSKNKVLRFLNTLEDDKKIIRDSDKMRTLITLVNYKDFQRKRDTNGDSDGDSDEDTNGDTDEDTSEDTYEDSDGTQTISKEYKEYKTLQENYIVEQGSTPDTISLANATAMVMDALNERPEINDEDLTAAVMEWLKYLKSIGNLENGTRRLLDEIEDEDCSLHYLGAKKMIEAIHNSIENHSFVILWDLSTEDTRNKPKDTAPEVDTDTEYDYGVFA